MILDGGRYIYHVVFLAVDPAVHVVEGLSPEGTPTGAADEAVGVVEVAHGLAGRSGTGYLLLAGVADAWNGKRGG